MKQFIICPKCGSIELLDISPAFVLCPNCKYAIHCLEYNYAKALSIKHPWAYLIATGIKDVENRKWKLTEKHKGQRVLLHAGAKIDSRNNQVYGLFTDE